jgi:hypothetical protein
VIITTPTGADVTIDLNGYSITGSTDTSYGIAGVGGVPSSITIRNGTLNGHVNAVYISAVAVLIEDLVMVRPRWNGVYIQSAPGSHAVVRRCVVARAGEATVANEGSDTRAIAITGSSGTIEDCTVSGVSNANPARGRFGIYQSGGTSVVIRRNVVNAAATGIRLDASPAIVYRDNTVTAATTAYSAAGATNGGGNI